MAQNSLKTVSPRDVITDDVLNQVIVALLGNLFPRSEAGIITPYAGDLGSQAVPWENIFARRVVAANLAEPTGPDLPLIPSPGDKFTRTGTNAGYYVCFAQGIWTRLGGP